MLQWHPRFIALVTTLLLVLSALTAGYTTPWPGWRW
jgi:hypothetical protein